MSRHRHAAAPVPSVPERSAPPHLEETPDTETRFGDAVREVRSREVLRSDHPDWFYEKSIPIARPHLLPQHAYRKLHAFLRRLSGLFGIRLTVLLFLAYFCVKGALYAFLESAILPYFQSYVKVSGERYHDYLTISTLPWSMKAIFGLISDFIPIRGYHKRYYIVLAGMGAAGALACIASLEFTVRTSDAAAILFFLSHMGIVVVDLLCEGHYARKMADVPESGSDIVSWVWGTYMCGQLIAAFCVGPLSDAGYIRQMFWICVPLAAQIVIPMFLGLLDERRNNPPRTTILTAKARANWKICLLAGFMGIITICLVFVSLYGTGIVKLMYSLIASAALCAASFRLMPRSLAKANLYMFMVEVLYVQVSGAGQFFLTAPPECVPNGPHFSYVFFQTTSSIVEAIFGAIGVMLFQSFFSGWRFQSIFWVTTCIRIVASIFDIIIVQRWNVQWGISDEALFLIGDRSLYKIAYMLDFMPLIVLTSKLCPRSLESTVYALLAGFQNFGQSISKSVGAYLIEAGGIRTTVPCDFQNFGVIMTVGHMILPLLALPLTFWLIPDYHLTDDMSKEIEEVATYFTGSGTGDEAHGGNGEDTEDSLQLLATADDEDEENSIL